MDPGSFQKKTFRQPTGSLISPNYPNKYQNGLNINWTIEISENQHVIIKVLQLYTRKGDWLKVSKVALNFISYLEITAQKSATLKRNRVAPLRAMPILLDFTAFILG